MNNPMSPGWGPCGLCGRNLPLMTPVTSLKLGDGRAHMVCQECPRKQDKLEKLGLVEVAPAEANPVVVSDPAVFAGSQLKVIEDEKPQPPEELPSMPVKEQTGTRRRVKKETPPDGPATE